MHRLEGVYESLLVNPESSAVLRRYVARKPRSGIGWAYTAHQCQRTCAACLDAFRYRPIRRMPFTGHERRVRALDELKVGLAGKFEWTLKGSSRDYSTFSWNASIGADWRGRRNFNNLAKESPVSL